MPTTGGRQNSGPVLVGEVTVSPGSAAFGGVTAGGASQPVTFLLSNQSPAAVQVTDVRLVGADGGEFALIGVPALPFGMRPGGKQPFDVVFVPTGKGLVSASLEFDSSVGGGVTTAVALTGHGLGPAGDELRIDLGGPGLTDLGGADWAASYGASGGAAGSSSDPVAGTDDDALYQTWISGPGPKISLPVPAGYYRVSLHLVEPHHNAPEQRVFSVLHEGFLAAFGIDVFALVGHDTAHTVTFLSAVTDGVLDLDFVASVGEPLVAAIEVVSVPLLDLDPGVVDFGAVSAGNSDSRTVWVTNFGGVDLTIDSLAILLGKSDDASGYSVDWDGQTYTGGTSDQVFALASVLAPMESRAMVVDFAPQAETFEFARIELTGNFGADGIDVQGLGGHQGHPFLHVVIDGPDLLIDFDGDGSETALFDGTTSHTHEPGKALVGYDWYVNHGFTASGMAVPLSLAIGESLVELEIFDDNSPTESLSDGVSVRVVTADAVPGVLASYFDYSGGDSVSALGGPLGKPDFAEVLDGFNVQDTGAIGSSLLTADAVVQLVGKVEVPTVETYDFQVSGGASSVLWVDGSTWTGPQQLAVGSHFVRAEVAVQTLADLPIDVTMTVGGGPATGVPSAWLTHDESLLAPTINSLPAEGTSLGGNEIVIDGLGFFPPSGVVVHWGATDLGLADFTAISPSQITFLSPPGSGTIGVTVETPNGVSNLRQFNYDDNGPVPVNFGLVNQLVLTGQPTCSEFGPDGKYYVGLRNGQLARITFDADYNATQVEYFPGVSSLSNPEIMGIAFDPYDAPSPVKVYVAHSELFADGGSAVQPGTYSEYPGQVSVLTGPAFDAPVALITNLPTSNHDHAVNGMVFDHNGDLLISIGSQTNAGVPHPNSGDLPESPLSAAMVKALTSRPDFNGALAYVETATGTVNNNQVFGGIVDLAPGTHVEVHAPGLRNAFDLTLHTNGRVYVTDNGPNFGFGPASSGASTQTSDPYSADEVLLIEPGNYYGSPNRNRGRYDERENVYHAPLAPPIAEAHTPAMAEVASSMNGLTEYRSDTFNGQLRGQLFTQKWANTPYRIELSDDGRAVEQIHQVYPWTGGLSVTFGPGGVLLSLNHFNQTVDVLGPVEPPVVGLLVQDITPWRAPATGGARFEIAGVGFGTLANTTVRIGGTVASLTSVSPTRIVGTVPATAAPTTELLDVVVSVGQAQDVHPAAFRYLLGVGQEPGFWETAADLPMTIGDAAAAVIDDDLYVVGDLDTRTAIYDFRAEAWGFPGTARPFAGRDHAAEVVGGKLYLIGGLGNGAEGQVQIYDPLSDQWSIGAPMPWAGGAVATAVIDGRIYAVGGIVAGTTVENFGFYDPVFNQWSTLPALPTGWGRNNAAAGTDGQRLFVFGGRRGGDVVGPAYGDVFIYDSATGAWESTLDVGSTLPALPAARAGMGRAVYRGGRFYVIGGETDTPSAQAINGVFKRVDVYDPIERTWKRDADLPTARQGADPVLFEARIFVAGGGLVAGGTGSTAFELFNKN